MQTLLHELDKLSAFCKDGEITAAVIDDMATKCLQARVYDLSKFILKGDTGGACKVLHTLFELGEEPIPIAAVLINHYVDMYRVKCAKIDGRRAYDMARKGKVADLAPKILVIDTLELLEFSSESITVRVVCSKGTYIRALARDIGSALESGGHLTALRRTRVGDAAIADCLTPDQLTEFLRIVPIERPADEALVPEKLKNCNFTLL